ncbi:MFS transporter [Herbiconiux sp. CPCC 203407]|uniref:Lysosomal dipeptide transporter MFSD1 n=1 Tax=Herbiconiux oxytropis TaxID=2970915 RepID=A0AA41XD91_9MICO|nr:MFS transporter [Herbiconiux oxytropis]MCS5720484.1 MFS transporter [Herbiconiux oxytropis]MCS5726057.1 MFS transporter [Herbiconiux oxytropis]
MNSRRAWLVFAVGVFAYMAGVLQRSSLGVAGVSAAERFDTTAALLSALAVLQLAVYAGLQIPIGLLIDRVGPKLLICAGSGVMVAGQLVVAFAPAIELAIAGRMLVGAGDAAIFISLIRLINSWFNGRTVPLLSQWTGNVGAIGQILSAVPFAWLLHEQGWTTAFTAAASVSFVGFVLTIAFLADRPAEAAETRAASIKDALHGLRQTIRRPGTQLGFWSHYVTQSSGTVFALFWGFPFMVSALGIPETTASILLVTIVVTGLIAGPILGILTARFPLRRSNLVLGVTALLGLVWGAVLLWPGVPPTWLIVVLVVTMGAGGPGSLIGFDFARSFNPIRSLGSANGIVNVGGFLASFVTMFLIGVILDAQLSAGWSDELYDLDAFRLAFAVQYAVVGFGVVMLLSARRRTRRKLEEDEGISVGPIWVALYRAWRRRGA